MFLSKSLESKDLRLHFFFGVLKWPKETKPGNGYSKTKALQKERDIDANRGKENEKADVTRFLEFG